MAKNLNVTISPILSLFSSEKILLKNLFCIHYCFKMRKIPVFKAHKDPSPIKKAKQNMKLVWNCIG